MGSDFQFTNANINFKNIDKIMTHVNDRWKNPHKYDFNSTEAQLPPINALYSTPSCYLKALNDDKRQTWPSKVDDFFPYASDPHAFWTGYFTSRYVYRFLDFHNFAPFANSLRNANNIKSFKRQTFPNKCLENSFSIDHIIDDKSQSWPTKSDDFFPYATDPHTFFTGYFSSRYVWMKSSNIFDNIH